VALLGARLFNHRLGGLLGGTLYLLAPIPLYFESEILIEPSYIFLICLALLTHLRASRSQGFTGAVLWLLCGALIALSAQARANMVIFLAVYPLFALWRWWRCRHRTALLPLFGLAGGAAMLFAWGFVNLRQSEHFQLIPSAGGVNLYLGNKRTADGMVPRQERCITYGERYEDSIEIWAREEYEAAMRDQGRVPKTDPMAVSGFWTARALAEIKAAPAAWLGLMAKKCWLTLWNAEVPNNKSFAFLQQEYTWLRVLPIRWVVLLMLAAPGVWAAARSGNRDAGFLLLTYAVLYSAANVAFFICDRYRYPVWPVMAVFGGGGLALLLETLRRRCWRRMALLLAVMAAMAAISLPNWFGAQLPSFARDFLFRSIAYYEKGRFPDALNDINRSLELDPLDANAHHHRGNVLFALNRLEEAKGAYERTLELNPGEAGAWNNLGATLDSLGRTAEALRAFRHAMECKPPSQNSFLGVAVIQIRTGQLDEAAATLTRLEQLASPPLAPCLALHARIERRRGNALQAADLERRARLLDPKVVDWATERTTP
jgi:tetratricopeptide (TPR) repeat protein